MFVDYTKVKNIFIVCGKTDMRKSIDGLATIILNQYNLDVFDDCVFLFCGGRRNKYKALYWDGGWLSCSEPTLMSVFGGNMSIILSEDM